MPLEEQFVTQKLLRSRIFNFLLYQISVDFHDFLPESPKFLEFKRKWKLFKVSNITEVMLKKREGKALTFIQIHNVKFSKFEQV